MPHLSRIFRLLGAIFLLPRKRAVQARSRRSLPQRGGRRVVIRHLRSRCVARRGGPTLQAAGEFRGERDFLADACARCQAVSALAADEVPVAPATDTQDAIIAPRFRRRAPAVRRYDCRGHHGAQRPQGLEQRRHLQGVYERATHFVCSSCTLVDPTISIIAYQYSKTY